MKVAALAGGIGAGKFLRGLVRVVPGDDLTVIVNVADDIVVHGLHVSPDPDSVTYWLGDAFDRERGWGRRDESFRATDEVAAFDGSRAWFGLGDLDLGTHLFRTGLLAEGVPLSAVVRGIGDRFGIAARLLPMSDDRVETRIDCIDAETGAAVDLHFQEYWVERRAADAVTGVRYLGASDARPAPASGRDRRGGRGRVLSVEPGGVDRADPRGPGHQGRGGRASGPSRRRQRDRRRRACGGDGGQADAGGGDRGERGRRRRALPGAARRVVAR